MPLPFMAIVKTKEFELFGRLDALGNDVDGTVPRKIDYRFNNGPGAGAAN
jgi:hypothetical protein